MVPLGILFHAIGGFAAGSFYLPIRKIKGWSWESGWLVNGIFSWLLAPLVVALLVVPDLRGLLAAVPSSTLGWTYFFTALLGKTSGLVLLGGLLVCRVGIAVCGVAGMAKDRDLASTGCPSTKGEYSFVKGVLVALFAGVMWYFQFMFYGMGTTKMGAYDFSSWRCTWRSSSSSSAPWSSA